MKIKMVKMGSDYTTPINCRLRGIVVTSDNKHLSVEIGCAYSPDIRHTSLTQKEYNIKYPNPQYVSINSCYRVDIPEDRYKNSTKEYSKYIRANFFEIPYTEKTNNFPGCSLKEKKEEQRIVQVFNFVCIAAAILCGMINYLTREKLDWFWFAAAGCLCGWLIVAVAYAKRRNILKNEIIQLILVTVIAVLWDKYTGWHGWSLDFVLPFGALAVLGSIPVIVKVQKLEKEEYLFYLVQAAFAGLVPLILMFLHLIRFPYPSVVCTGISLLVFAGMFIFNSNDTIREFHKKLRM